MSNSHLTTDKLINFTNSAVKNELESAKWHEVDYNRFNDAIVASFKNDSPVGDLPNFFQEQGFSEKYSYELADKFEAGLHLLKYYEKNYL